MRCVAARYRESKMSKPEFLAKMLNVETSAVRAAMIARAIELESTAAEAERLGKKIRGYTAQQYRELAANLRAGA